MHALFTTALGASLEGLWMWQAMEILALMLALPIAAVAILARIVIGAKDLRRRQLSQREFEAWPSACSWCATIVGFPGEQACGRRSGGAWFRCRHSSL